MVRFVVNKISDIDNIPENVTHLTWTINHPITQVQYLSNLTHLNLNCYFVSSFKCPPNIQYIKTFGDESPNFKYNDLFSLLYINYSEYIINGPLTIQVNNNKIKIYSRYYHLVNNSWLVEFMDRDKKIKTLNLDDITFDDIDEFLSPTIDLKPAKNK